MRTNAHDSKMQVQPAINPASLPYVGFDGARALLGGCSETYLRDLVARRVLTGPVRLPGGRGRRLFHVATLIADLDRLRAEQGARESQATEMENPAKRNFRGV